MALPDGSGALIYAAYVCVFDAEGRILLVAEEHDRPRYGLPGGGVEPGETPAEAANRELMEEACVKVHLDHLIGMFRFNGRLDFLAFVFHGTVVEGEPRVPPTGEILDIGWFDPDNLPSSLVLTASHTIGAAIRDERGVIKEITLVDA